MSFSLDDFIALFGLACLLAGIFLWFGLPPALIVLGLVLIYIGARLPITPGRSKQNEPD